MILLYSEHVELAATNAARGDTIATENDRKPNGGGEWDEAEFSTRISIVYESVVSCDDTCFVFIDM